MISGLLKKVFGSRNDRLIKQYSQTVKRINALEPQMQALSDEALRAKTDEFRQRHANGESLDDLLPEAFAVVREAGKRELGMRHFDVQLIGGMVKRGEALGAVGVTGRSTGPHLHFEVRMRGIPQNPAQFLKQGEEFAQVKRR